MTFPPCYEDIIELGLPDGDLLPCDDTDVFTSKLGGRPVWLTAPSKELLDSLKCPKCSTELYLLLQMDCPREEYPTIDRVAYILACNTRLCSQDPAGWRVIFMMKPKNGAEQVESKQTETKASFWDSLMNDKEDEDNKNSLLSASGKNFSESSCAAVPLMPRKNQFPGLYLHIDEEIIVEKREKKSAIVEIPVSADATTDNSNEDWSGEQYEKVRAPGTDKSFNRFTKRVAHYPRQCVRYAVSAAQTPLLYHDLDIATAVYKLGTCSKCTTAPCNRFELQLMPAILAFLPTESPAHLQHIPEAKKSKNPFTSDGMEWGTVLVYSCGAFCGLEKAETVVEGRVIIQLELQQ